MEKKNFPKFSYLWKCVPTGPSLAKIKENGSSALRLAEDLEMSMKKVNSDFKYI
jgi:hypothetical protein